MTEPDFQTDFQLFWAAFPRRQAKKDALKAWRQLKPTTATVQAILDALRWQTQTDQWKRGIIPLPASYLRGERWTDEGPVCACRPPLTQAEQDQVARIRERQRQEHLLDVAEYAERHPDYRPSKPS